MIVVWAFYDRELSPRGALKRISFDCRTLPESSWPFRVDLLMGTKGEHYSSRKWNDHGNEKPIDRGEPKEKMLVMETAAANVEQEMI